MLRKKTMELSRLVVETRKKEQDNDTPEDEVIFVKKVEVHSGIQTTSVSETRKICLMNDKFTERQSMFHYPLYQQDICEAADFRMLLSKNKKLRTMSKNHSEDETLQQPEVEENEECLQAASSSESFGETAGIASKSDGFAGFRFPGNKRVLVCQEFVDTNYELCSNGPCSLLQEKMTIDASTQTDFSFKGQPVILFERLKEKQILYFTGFSLGQFKSIFKFIYSHKSAMSVPLSKFTCCSTVNQLLLTLYKYKLNPDFKMLAALFNVTSDLAFKIFQHWTEIIYISLKSINFLSIEAKNCNLYRICLHCMTVPCLQNLASNQEQIHYKCLIGINEGGIVTFCSDLFDSNLSFQEVFLSSKILDFLSQGDVILTSRDFGVSDILKEKGILLNISPFIIDINSSSLERHIQARHLLNRKVHSDRLASLSNAFNILSKPIISDFVPIYSKIMFNCTMLCNIKPKNS